MATDTVTGETRRTAEPVVVMRAVKKAVVVYGDCRYHVPQATGPGSWCGPRRAELRGPGRGPSDGLQGL